MGKGRNERLSGFVILGCYSNGCTLSNLRDEMLAFAHRLEEQFHVLKFSGWGLLGRGPS